MNEIATTQTHAVEVESRRAIAEVQASIEVARKMPRDEDLALKKMLRQCATRELAEQGVFAFKRGNKLVDGLSIRTVEMMARCWGNIHYGTRELSRGDGTSYVQTFARDLETNTCVTREFNVKHWRDTKEGGYAITDGRDIYEMVQNQASRRVRACIEEILPVEFKTQARKAIEKTLTKGKDTSSMIADLLGAFEKQGVSKERIEKRLGHNLDAMTPSEIVTLRSVYKSIADGFAEAITLFPEDREGDANAALAGSKKE